VSNIVQTARYLVRGFSAATRRAGRRRKNPSLDIFLAVFTSASVAVLTSALVSVSASASASVSVPAPAPVALALALAPVSAPVSAPALLSEETGQRIASIFKALVDLYSRSFKDRNLLIGLFRKGFKEGFLFKESF
jgi:hypothetical protein